MKRKTTGEMAFFGQIWMNTPMYHRTCFVTGERINNFHPMIFAHILPKGEFPELRLDEANIVLMRADLHSKQHSVPRSELEAMAGTVGAGFRKFFALQDERRAQHNTANP